MLSRNNQVRAALVVILAIIVIVAGVYIYVNRSSAPAATFTGTTAATDTGTTAGGTQAPEVAAYRVGGLFALSGVGESWGSDEADATRLAFEEVNAAGGIEGMPLELVLEDAPAEDPEASAAAFLKLAEADGLPVVLGPTWDMANAAVAPLADEQGVVVISADASTAVQQGAKGYYFAMYPPERGEMDALVGYMKSQGVQSVAYVIEASDDPFNPQWRDAFVAASEASGLAVVAELGVPPEETDFEAYVRQLTEAKPDAIYLELMPKSQFMRQARDLGLETMFTSSATSDTQSLLEEAGTNLDGLVIASPAPSAETEAFAARFEQRYGYAPRSLGAQYAYDAAGILVYVLRQGARRSAEVRSALAALEGYDGVTGSGMSFDATGRAVRAPIAYQIEVAQGGAFVAE